MSDARSVEWDRPSSAGGPPVHSRPAPRPGPEPAPSGRYGPFFDCTFVWTPRELVGEEPYVVFEDEQSQPFAARLITACRGEAGFRGVVRDLEALPGDDTVVVCEAPVWRRRFKALAAAGVRGPRARVLLYFDVDPTGFWDFAEACGDALREIFLNGVTTDTVGSLEPYLEKWAGCRVSRGRIAPYAQFYTRDYYPLHEQSAVSIVRVMAAFADDESRAAYARILFGSPEQVLASFASSVWGEQQYMAIVRPEPGDVIVNCGVGRGWELPYFLARLRGEGHIHNIDPNMVHFSSHSGAFISHFAEMMTDHEIVLGDRDGSIALAMADAGMVISTEGQVAGANGASRTYPMRSLDSLMAEGMAERLDYLKMDVEGGERAILRGAIETIRKHRPKLAVAIYHEPHHLWEYPCFILDHLEDYRLYLRQYGYSRFETLLYAVPAEAAETTSGRERLPSPSAPPRPRAASDGPLVLAYLRDAPSHPRAFYVKPIRPLTRAHGVDWESADLAPGPDVSAEHVDAVIETASGAVVLTRHRAEDGRFLVSVGLSRRPVEMTWLHAAEAPPDAVCVAVDADDDAPGYLVYSPSGGDCALHEIREDDVLATASFPLAARPFAARWRDGQLEVLCRGSEAGTLDIVRPMSGAAASRKTLPPGELLGVATIKRVGDAGFVRSAALVTRAPGSVTASIHAETASGFERVAELAWDDRFELVTTLTSPRAAVSPPTRSWWRDLVLDSADRVGARRALERVVALVRQARNGG